MRSHTCCFTGHREIPPEKRAEIVGRLERVIVSLYQRGIQYYGAGGARGFDCLAAQTVLRLRESCPDMKLILVLPCLTQTSGTCRAVSRPSMKSMRTSWKKSRRNTRPASVMTMIRP